MGWQLIAYSTSDFKPVQLLTGLRKDVRAHVTNKLLTLMPVLEGGLPVRLALSGGGFRATLFHLGVIRYLRETGLLRGVTEIYSVSGGSIFAAHLVQNWEQYTDANSEDGFNNAAQHLIAFTRNDLRGRVVGQWIRRTLFLTGCVVVPPSQILFWTGFNWMWMLISAAIFTITAVFALWYWTKIPIVSFLIKEYDAFYKKATVTSLFKNGRPRLHILATNLTTGGPAYFDHKGVTLELEDDSSTRIDHESIPLAVAVAASSAFPPVFSPVVITQKLLMCDKSVLPHPHYLSDGGVFDNLGIDIAQRLHSGRDLSDVVLSDAERRFDEATDERFEFVVARASRASDIMMLRLSNAETKSLGLEAKSIRLQDDWPRTAANHVQPSPPAEDTPFMGASLQRGVRNLRTDLDEFSALEIQLLYFKGYGAARAMLSGEVGPVPGVAMTPMGVPLTALAPVWLPITNDDPGLTIEPREALRNGSTQRLKRGPKIIVALLLTLIIALSWPCFGWLVGAYQQIGMRPNSLSTHVVRSSDIGDSPLLKGQEWIAITCSRLQSGMDCKSTADAIIVSQPLGWETYGRHPRSFRVQVVPKPSEHVTISDIEAFVVRGSKEGIVPLPCDSNNLGRVVYVPDCFASDQIVIVARLCSHRDGDDSFSVRPIADSISINILEVDP